MRAIETVDVSTLPLYAVAIRRGNLASLGTTDAKQLKMIMIHESVCATMYIALHGCANTTNQQGL